MGQMVMIHACEDRIKYVRDFMVPLLIESGVSKNNIKVYTDHGDGCLKSYIKSFESLTNLDDYTWHLQDDVLPSLRFCDMADGLVKIFTDNAIICGFGNKNFYSDANPWFAKNGDEMFYSFPCIGIPNYIAISFTEWFHKIRNLPEYQKWVVHNKFVDYLFKLYIGDNSKRYDIINFRPCLVEHVDEFVGGSTINSQRPKLAKAIDFRDEEAMKRLMVWYKKYGKEQK